MAVDQLSSFMRAEQLPDTFRVTVDQYFVPLAHWLYGQWTRGGVGVIGINGAQGTGKSTLSALLKLLLEETYGCRVAVLSLDDLYLPRTERKALAQSVHPLLQTRGVPGTHDTRMGIEIINRLRQPEPREAIRLPRFDKALDERKPCGDWELFVAPADLVIFEGWCVGSTPMTDCDLVYPINSLEIEEDPDGVWRNYINLQLKTCYSLLFACLDLLIMLKAPDFDCIRCWRSEQERKLAGTNSAKGGVSKIMEAKDLVKFIQHYERLTRHNLEKMPERADVLLGLDAQHRVVEMQFKATY